MLTVTGGTVAANSSCALSFSIAAQSVGLDTNTTSVVTSNEGGSGPAATATIRIVPPAHDFNGDGYSDIAWRDSNGTPAAWLMNGTTITQVASWSAVPSSWQIVGQRDIIGNGEAEWLWRDGASGTMAMWYWTLTSPLSPQSFSFGVVPTNWSVVGTGDFNGDGHGDALWYDTNSGTVAIWFMNGENPPLVNTVGAVPTNWQIVGTGDFNGDGMTDILWRDSQSGTVVIWLMNGPTYTQVASLGVLAANWRIAGTGDFNGDGHSDILLRDNQTGTVATWLMNGTSVSQIGSYGAVPSNWIIAETGDYNGDGNSDLLWRDSNSGTVAIWFMNGIQSPQVQTVSSAPTSDWTIQGLNAD